MMNFPKIRNSTIRDIIVDIGLVLRHGPSVFRINEIRGDVLVLQNLISLQDMKVIPTQELLAAIGAGEIVLADEADTDRALRRDPFKEDELNILVESIESDLSESQKLQVVRIARYIRGLRALGYTCLSPKNPTIQLDLNRLQRKFGDKNNPKAAWVYKWSLALDRANGDIQALVPLYQKRGGAGKHRLPNEVEAAYTTVLDRIERDEDKKIKTCDIVDDVKALVAAENPNRADLVIAINWSCADRRINERFTPFERCKRNHGHDFANAKYRQWYPRENAGAPLLVWETDDTDSTVFTIDERSGLPSGRSYITPCIDQDAQTIMGVEMSEMPRSTWSAISSVVNSILPTNAKLPEFAECRSGVEFYGKPGIIVFDNALYNHAHEIELIAGQLGVIPAWAKPRTPTEKSYQEGWNGRIKSEFLCNLPGYRGNPDYREGLKVGMASANMGLLDFKQRLMKWIYDVYSNQPLADGMSPRQKWHLGMRYIKPRIPADLWGYKLAPCIHKSLKLRPEGILFCGLIYSSPFLQQLRHRYGHNATVIFRFNPGNLGEIYAQDPESKAYSPVPCTNPEYTAGLTLYQHKLIRKLCRENKLRNPSIPQLLIHREELRRLTDDLRNSKRYSERKRSARTGELPSPSEHGGKSIPSEKIIVTDLEDHILDIDEVEMDLDDDGWTLPDIY